MRRVTSLPAQAGVTLVEMIVSIVVGGILVALVGMFGRWQIQSYFDISSRASLTDAADTAVRRIGRDLQAALPNSVRVNGNLLEFVPIIDAGRYRAEFTLAGAGNPLDFLSATDTSFDVLGPTVNVSTGQSLVIFNLGLPGSDVYSESSRRTLTSIGNGLAGLSFTGSQFPFASPANRFHIVGSPVTYGCDLASGTLRRYWNYGFIDPQVSSAAAISNTSSILVDNVADCRITYTPGALQRNGLVSINLTLSANGETVNLLHQVEVLNTP